ncbi:MAG TPA: sugar phosphate isomerase/epimerase family protein [Ktedonobacteraceae bacterium]|jgi:sugar phosphate isomerase/epimerase|nr:sugar phosphate isomerase/epimerase family protein [Ktedonobacteraceae bacterium]
MVIEMQEKEVQRSAQIISFMGANYVAREVGYHMTGGWGEGDSASNAYFQPIETFAQRFDQLLGQIRSLGFRALDLWMAHLNWQWATSEHITIATQLLTKHQLTVTSLAGFFGSTREEFEATCRIATAVGTNILGGGTALLESDRPTTVATLKHYGVKLALENHPQEKTARDMLSKIGDGADGSIGTAIDTGWYATNGYDAVRAIEELAGSIIHVHLKDVLAPGAHETCRYGRGCVDIPSCIQALRHIGYDGAYSIEHEPELFDPSEDCVAMLAQLHAWLRNPA